MSRRRTVPRQHEITLDELRWEEPDFNGPPPVIDDSLQTASVHTPAQARALSQSMQRRGFILSSRITCARDGRVVDGAHRLREAQRQGLVFEVVYLQHGYSDDELREISRLLNHARRHETAEDWAANEALIQQSLREEPNLSNRERAKKYGVDEATVRRSQKRNSKSTSNSEGAAAPHPVSRGSGTQNLDGVANGPTQRDGGLTSSDGSPTQRRRFIHRTPPPVEVEIAGSVAEGEPSIEPLRDAPLKGDASANGLSPELQERIRDYIEHRPNLGDAEHARKFGVTVDQVRSLRPPAPAGDDEEVEDEEVDEQAAEEMTPVEGDEDEVDPPVFRRPPWPKDIKDDYEALKVVVDRLPLGNSLKVPAEQSLTRFVTRALAKLEGETR